MQVSVTALARKVTGAFRSTTTAAEVKAVFNWMLKPDHSCRLSKEQAVELLHKWDNLRLQSQNLSIAPLKQFVLARYVEILQAHLCVICLTCSSNRFAIVGHSGQKQLFRLR
jgi:hypothetical protein